jgi:hypothetical protein
MAGWKIIIDAIHRLGYYYRKHLHQACNFEGGTIATTDKVRRCSYGSEAFSNLGHGCKIREWGRRNWQDPGEQRIVVRSRQTGSYRAKPGVLSRLGDALVLLGLGGWAPTSEATTGNMFWHSY